MVNAMEWLLSQEKYNTKEKRREIEGLYIDEKQLESHLDLSEFVNLTELRCSYNNLTSLDLSKNVNLTELRCHDNNLTSLDVSKNINLNKIYCQTNKLTSLDVSKNINLTELGCSYNNLTSVDFLNDLPNPKKLTLLQLSNNNIARTNLEFLRPFVNLSEKLTLGNDEPGRYNNNIYNRFYGSLEPLRNMTELWGLCIDGTDVEEGIEYLPTGINNKNFNCSPKLPNQKVAKIQDQLRPFNYDIEAWQLAHPEKMLIARPEYFTNPDSKDKWLTSLNNKILQVREEIITAKGQEADKLAKITRLESKISELETAKVQISQQTQTEFSTQNKSTQTDLTMEQIKQWEQEDKKKTLYQKYIEKYGK